MTLLQETAIFLAAAVLTVPIFNRLGLSSVLGYLAAGLLIGPWGLAFITNVENILHFAEIGVVLLLFLIGLELAPTRLWVMRRAVFGLGALQVTLTGALLAGAGLLLGLTIDQALVVGLGLALSSTAFVLQMLSERRELNTTHGRASFSVLLFQDLAVVPLLALVSLLGARDTGGGDLLLGVLEVTAMLAVVVVAGRYLLRPVFRVAAGARTPEIFTAASLLVVVGAALALESVGLSMALGAFLAGVLLADSEYRHEIEAGIEPFKGLLLGLFFISVGMSVNVGLLAAQGYWIVALMLGLVVAKMLLLYPLARAYGLAPKSARRFAIALPQGGEFAFVLFTAAVAEGVLSRSVVEPLIVAVTLSMMATPILYTLHERWLPARTPDNGDGFDTIEDTDHAVVIAGFGRVGQIVGRVLRAMNIPYTVLDADPEQVEFVRRYGNKVYYGDVTRLDLLRAARLGKARILVVALSDVEASMRTVQLVKRHFPEVRIYARARDRHHAHLLMEAGVKGFVRETLLSSLDLTEQVLTGLGVESERAHRAVRTFERQDREVLKRQFAFHRDEERLIQSTHESARELRELFELDHKDGGVAEPEHSDPSGDKPPVA